MNYHNILHDDMRNGEGLRVVLFVSGCEQHCPNCQNPQTWDKDSGIEFDLAAKEEIFEQLNKDYISGITFSGGDPLHKNNVDEIYSLICEIKDKFPTKTIWLYTGYTWEHIKSSIHTRFFAPCEESTWCSSVGFIMSNIDVLVDGRFVEELADVKYPWAGSTNQRVIDVQKSLEKGEIVLWDTF
jgi:anaerobic ribonucleoside-triphosphate reductase activating protein